MVQVGPKYLSNSELLAIIISCGTKKESALDLSRKLLAQHEEGLAGMAQADYSDLLKFEGIGRAKACQILALTELAVRINQSRQKPKVSIQSSKQAYELMIGLLSNLKYEAFWVILLNRANQVIKKVQISDGGVFQTTADPIRIFKSAIESCATGIILAHNHPSNRIKPSKHDLHLTSQLCKGARLLNITVLDHLILGRNKYYSFKDAGLLDSM